MPSILIVDDDPQQIKLYSQVLASDGHDVSPAVGGKEALDCALARPPDLILTDVRMNGMDGLALLRSIRNAPELRSTPVIIMTAEDLPEVKRLAMEAMADDFLVKPFPLSALSSAVEARLERNRLAKLDADRRLDSLRNAVLSALPHELQTPLATVLGYAQLLRSDAEDLAAADVARMAGIIQSAGLRLEHFVERYLAYVELEVLKHDADRLREALLHVVDAAPAFACQAALHCADRHGRRADVHVTHDGTSSRVRMPKRWLTYLIDELVDNACKFTTESTRIEMRAETVDSELSVMITDNGQGMTPDQIQSLGLLVQHDRAAKEQHGTGLGLALVRRVAELFGADVEFESGDGSGLTASLRIPVFAEHLAEWDD